VDEATMRSRVAAAEIGRLATVTAEGRPHLVPCCFAVRGDTAYSAVDHKPKSTQRLRRLANLRANPNAALLVDHYADDWSTLWWVRADGTGRILDDGPDLADAIALLVAKYRQYREDPPLGPVIAIDVDTWRGWP
jgi:PPOX class probable F420-dependent enzyme